MTGLRPQLESKFSDVHSHRTPSWKILQNCSGASRVSSSQYHTMQCTASSQPRGSAKESRTNSIHPPSGPAGSHRKKETRNPCAQALLLTGAPGCRAESATGSRQCNSLQCSLVHGSGRLNSTLLTEQDRRARGTRQQDSEDNKRTNESQAFATWRG